VIEGFENILDWQFESRVIPQRVVQYTGGHPAFVQYFCMKLQERGRRGDRMLKLNDVQAVFEDLDPKQSFMAFVKDHLSMNLDPVGEFLILWLVVEYGEVQRFTRQQIEDLVGMSSMEIPPELLERSLERLVVTSVVKERAHHEYEFSVPDYPYILKQLGDIGRIDEVEDNLKKWLEESVDARE
ncbi:MAG: hypothetical protein D6732_05405, partial [Methanobacteriota archaeon]